MRDRLRRDLFRDPPDQPVVRNVSLLSLPRKAGALDREWIERRLGRYQREEARYARKLEQTSRQARGTAPPRAPEDRGFWDVNWEVSPLLVLPFVLPFLILLGLGVWSLRRLDWLLAYGLLLLGFVYWLYCVVTGREFFPVGGAGPRILADADGLEIQQGRFGRVAWWELQSVDDRGAEWVVQTTRGSFRIEASLPHNDRLREMILTVLKAQEWGYSLPGQPPPVDETVSEAALSRATAASEDDERGLTRVDA